MGKPRKSPEPAEKDCCIRERERRVHLIRKTFSAFAVIKDLPCPECRQWVRIRVYDRAALEGAS